MVQVNYLNKTGGKFDQKYGIVDKALATGRRLQLEFQMSFKICDLACHLMLQTHWYLSLTTFLKRGSKEICVKVLYTPQRTTYTNCQSEKNTHVWVCLVHVLKP